MRTIQPFSKRFRLATLCGLACALATTLAFAQGGGGYGGGGYGGGMNAYRGSGGAANYGQYRSNYRPDYQDHSGYGQHSHRRDAYQQYPNHAANTNYNYGFYQRPYPFHLDYYRMRYGGSYDPYFGNLYGPPLVQQFLGPPFVGSQVVAPGGFFTPGFSGPTRGYAGSFYW